MAILSPAQKERLGLPPIPPMPTVALMDPKTGKPTQAFTDWLNKVHEWQRRLTEILGE